MQSYISLEAKSRITFYGNCWVTVWTTDWTPGERTLSALGAQVKAIHLCDQKGVEPGSTSPRPHLMADCHWGRISFWVSLLFGVFHCKPRSLDISEHFFFDSLFCTMIIFLTITPVKYHSNHATLSTQNLLTVQEDTGRWVQVVLREVLTWFKNYVLFFFF